MEFEDQQSGSLTMSKIASLYQKAQDNSLLTEVAKMFDMSEAEVKESFENVEE